MIYKNSNSIQYIMLEDKDKMNIFDENGDLIEIICDNENLVVDSNNKSNLNIVNDDNDTNIFSDSTIERQFCKWCDCCNKYVLITEESDDFIPRHYVYNGEYDCIIRDYEATIGYCPKCGNEIDIKIRDCSQKIGSTFMCDEINSNCHTSPVKSDIDFIDVNKIKLRPNQKIQIINEKKQFIIIINQDGLLATGNFRVKEVKKMVTLVPEKAKPEVGKMYCSYCERYVDPRVDDFVPMKYREKVKGEYDNYTISYEAVYGYCPYCKDSLGPVSVQKVKSLGVRNY